MSEQIPSLLSDRTRSNRIKLRTLILLRWVAVVGQLTAILVSLRFYDLKLELGLCLLTVGVSVIANLIASFIFPENKRLSEAENRLTVLFDLLQLSILLYLTGGLHNPFAILVTAPVIVSATSLSLRSTVLLGALAVVIISALAKYHLVLQTNSGTILRLPDVFVFGNWVALIIALVFVSVYSRRITDEIHSMSDALAATQMALSREQKLTDLGGVVAAAAHELGTPLATIKLTSAELMDELEDRQDLFEDAQLIHQQADRCRDILRAMGRAGNDDLHMRQAPLTTMISDAADPHRGRGKEIYIEEHPQFEEQSHPPSILRVPEFIHGMRNLIQNAVDFAETTVWIEVSWTDQQITVLIIDDGEGFPPQLIGRIGDPFMPRHRSDKPLDKRPAYEGMGLGLFIAKTLLERTGAELNFANGSNPFLSVADVNHGHGAIVEVTWPRSKIDAKFSGNRIPQGQNMPIKV